MDYKCSILLVCLPVSISAKLNCFIVWDFHTFLQFYYLFVSFFFTRRYPRVVVCAGRDHQVCCGKMANFTRLVQACLIKCKQCHRLSICLGSRVTGRTMEYSSTRWQQVVKLTAAVQTADGRPLILVVGHFLSVVLFHE